MLVLPTTLSGAHSRRSACATRNAPVSVSHHAHSARQLPYKLSSPWHKRQPRRGHVIITNGTDYVSTASDDGVLRLAPRTELAPSAIQSVFGFPRNLSDKYYVGPSRPRKSLWPPLPPKHCPGPPTVVPAHICCKCCLLCAGCMMRVLALLLEHSAFLLRRLWGISDYCSGKGERGRVFAGGPLLHMLSPLPEQ
jgi:hypothetical protein